MEVLVMLRSSRADAQRLRRGPLEWERPLVGRTTLEGKAKLRKIGWTWEHCSKIRTIRTTTGDQKSVLTCDGRPIDHLPVTFLVTKSDLRRLSGIRSAPRWALGRCPMGNSGEQKEMAKRGAAPLQGEVLQGTLDLLILQTLILGPAHGHT